MNYTYWLFACFNCCHSNERGVVFINSSKTLTSPGSVCQASNECPHHPSHIENGSVTFVIRSVIRLRLSVLVFISINS